jgi:hypothetical protein
MPVTKRQVNSIAKASDTKLKGDVTLTGGTNVTLTQSGQDISIAASGGGDVATDAIWDAKGDLAGGTGANTASRLAVGTNLYSLVADSGEATGLRWSEFSLTGWMEADESWSYASASTITVPSGAASKYQKGDRIKWTQTTVKYGVIVAVADTVLTIAVNTDYTVANAAISLNYYSHQANPIGYPDWFNFTTTFTGFSAAPNTAMKYRISGHTCWIEYQAAGATGTSNATTFTFTVPVAPLLTEYLFGWCRGYDNGAHLSTPCQLKSTAASATIDVYKTNYQGAWTASGEKIVTFPPISYEF